MFNLFSIYLYILFRKQFGTKVFAFLPKANQLKSDSYLKLKSFHKFSVKNRQNMAEQNSNLQILDKVMNPSRQV